MRYLIAALFLTLSLAAWASSADYVFSVDSAPYTEITGVQLVEPGETNETAAGVNIGFNFIYNGQLFTQFGACSNGYLVMGDDDIHSRSNDLSSAYYNPLVAALWDYQKTDDTGEITYTLQGDAPNRVLVVQFTNMRWYKSMDPINLVNYQIRLYEGSNNIEFHYGAFGGAPGSNASASIGINMMQNSANQFVSITPGAPATASTTDDNNDIGAADIGNFVNGMIYRLTYSPLNQSINAATVSQASTSAVELGDYNQEVLRVNVNTSNSGNPYSVTGLSFTNSGTLADGAARLYYTGADDDFSTASSLGDAVAITASDQSLAFTFSQELIDGDNYFWLAYDVPGDYACLGATLDAVATAIVIPDDTTPLTTPDPAGERLADDTQAPAISFSSLSSTYNASNRVLAGVSISEAVSMSVTPRMYYKKSANANVFGDNTAAFDGWKYAEGVFENDEWSFTLDTSLLYGGLVDSDVVQYFVAAQDDKPGAPNIISRPEGLAGTVEAPTAAPSFSYNYTVIMPLAGDYFVGPGQDITSLYDFFTYAEQRGVEGDATIWLTGDIEEPDNAELDTLTEYGTGGYSITFRPVSGTPVTVSGDFSGSLIALDEVSNIIIDGGENMELTIASSYYRGRCIELKDGCSDITLRNLKLFIADDEPNSSSYCIYNSSGGVDNLLIDNIEAHSSGYGIYFSGSSSDYCNNITIQNSRIGADTADGYFLIDPIYMRYQDNLTITGCDIGGALSDSWEPRGIELSYVTNVEISANKIHDILYEGTSGMSSKGIYIGSLAGDNPGINIYNNMLWRFGGDCDYPAYIPAGIRLSGASTGGVSICNNSIHLPADDTYGMGDYEDDFTFCAAVQLDNSSGACPTGVVMKNNIFDNRLGERTGNTLPTIATAVYVRSSGAFTSPFADVSNNLYFTANADTNVVALHYDNDSAYTCYNTLGDWTAITGETGALNVDPLFDVADPIHLLEGSPAIGAGVAIIGLDTDIDGDPRNDPPCIGADERSGGALETPADIAISESNGQITVSWSAVTTATSYNVYTATSPDGEFTLLQATGDTFVTITPTANMQYFRVTSVR